MTQTIININEKANAKEMGLIFRGYMARQTERKDLYAGK